MPARDVLSITGLGCECVVGVYPHERGRPQPLRIDIDLFVDTDAAGRSGRLSRTVDYDAAAQAVIFLLQSCRFGLLETAAHALSKFLLAPPAAGESRAAIQSVRLKLIKPEKFSSHIHSFVLNETSDTLYLAAHGKLASWEFKADVPAAPAAAAAPAA